MNRRQSQDTDIDADIDRKAYEIAGRLAGMTVRDALFALRQAELIIQESTIALASGQR